MAGSPAGGELPSRLIVRTALRAAAPRPVVPERGEFGCSVMSAAAPPAGASSGDGAAGLADACGSSCGSSAEWDITAAAGLTLRGGAKEGGADAAGGRCMP